MLFTDLDNSHVLMDERTLLDDNDALRASPEKLPREAEQEEDERISASSLMCAIEVGRREVACAIMDTAPSENQGAGTSLSGVGFADMPEWADIVDSGKLSKALGKAVENAEGQAGHPVSGAVVATSIGRIDSIRLRGRVSLGWAPISDADLARAIGAAFADFRLPQGRALHALPMHWRVDDNTAPTNDPRGVKGLSLEVDLLLVTIDEAAYQIVAKSMEEAHLDLKDLAATPLVKALTTLSNKEMQGSTLCLDLGRDYVGFAVFQKGAVVHVGTLPFGEDDLADITSRLMGMPFSAVRVALEQVVQSPIQVRQSDALMVALNGLTTNVNTGELITALTDALQEQLRQVLDVLTRRGLPVAGAGIVYTGSLAPLAEMAASRRTPLGGGCRTSAANRSAFDDPKAGKLQACFGMVHRALHGPREALSNKRRLARRWTPLSGYVPVLSETKVPRQSRRPRAK